MAERNPSKPTTLDDLAAMINHGFTETQHDLDKCLGGMDQRLDVMEGVVSAELLHGFGRFMALGQIW
jgi:hypothetical protein